METSINQITLNKLQEALNIPMDKPSFLRLIFPETLKSNDKDKLVEFIFDKHSSYQGNRSRFLNGNIKSGNRDHKKVLTYIASQIKSGTLFHDMSELLSRNFAVSQLSSLPSIIDMDSELYPNDFYIVLKECEKSNLCLLLLWMILWSVFGERIVLLAPYHYAEGILTQTTSIIHEKHMYKTASNFNASYNINCDFSLTLDKSTSGDYNAMFEIACMYLYGFHSSKGIDYTEASRWLKAFIEHPELNAAKTDESWNQLQCAKGMLANLYFSGCVLFEEQSFQKAMEILQEISAESNDDSLFASSMEKLLFMVSDGIGTEFDFYQIIDCFEKHKRKCSTGAKNNMAKFYMRYGMYDEAIKILQSIEKNHPDAEYKLGIIYLHGLHTTPPQPDVYRAEHYLMRAADVGHLDALHTLGLMNFRGQYGYQKNMKKAREYYLLAATQEHRGAQYDYAWMCKYGLGGKCDIPEAIRFFEKSATKGHMLSMAELAVLYQIPVCMNYQKAFEWALKAASAGDPQSEFILGNLYYFGRGCESNPNEAVLWYKKALKHGFYQAKFMLDKINLQFSSPHQTTHGEDIDQ